MTEPIGLAQKGAATMYKSIRIQNFRGIKDLEIKDLGRVNLIVGANNVGKSSVLEALSLLHMHRDGYEIGLMLENRGYQRFQSYLGALTRLFYNGASDHAEFRVEAFRSEDPNPFELIGRTNPLLGTNDAYTDTNFYVTLPAPPGRQFSDETVCLFHRHSREEEPSFQIGGQVTISINPDRERVLPKLFSVGPFGDVSAVPSATRISMNDLAGLLSNIQGDDSEDRLWKDLRKFDSRIRRLSVAFDGLRQLGYVNVIFGEGVPPLPLGLMGEGTRRILEMIVLLPLASGGLGLIDEVEAGVFHGNLPLVWKTIDDLSSSSNVQVFATTHSWECVTAAVKEFQSDPEAFRICGGALMRSPVEESATPEFEEEVKRLLLVEGPTDVGFFEAMLAVNQRLRVRVHSLGGKSGLPGKVRARMQAPGYENLEWIGIVIDGDDNPDGRFKSAQAAIRALGVARFSVPDRTWSRAPRGETAGSASIAILPNGVLGGNIERYFWLRVMGHHPAAECIETMIRCLEACGIDKTEDWKTRRFSFLHAAGPERSDPMVDGRRMFDHTPVDSHRIVLDLIPADNEEI